MGSVTVRDQIYRARVAGVTATLTSAQWQKTLNHFKKRCAYCGGRYDALEHVVPVSRGGGTTYTNCVPSCASCNTCKDHPKFILFGTNKEAVAALNEVKDYFISLQEEDFDLEALNTYIATQMIKVPVHHLDRRGL